MFSASVCKFVPDTYYCEFAVDGIGPDGIYHEAERIYSRGPEVARVHRAE